MGSKRVVAFPAWGVLVGTSLLLLGCSGGSHQGHQQSLSADGFTTAYPQGWTLTVKRKPGLGARYQLSSSGAQVNGLGIGPAGTIGITIDEVPASVLSRFHLVGDRPDLRAARQTAVELLPHTIGTPRMAEEVVRAQPPRGTLLGGADAAEEAYSYTLAGVQNVQADIISRHAGNIVTVELDAEPALGASGQAALAAITDHWRWR